MSPRELLNVIDGWQRLWQMNERQAYERARYIAKPICSVLLPRKERAKLDAVFELPWDRDDSFNIEGESRVKAPAIDHEKEAQETIRIGKKLDKVLKNGINRS